MSRKLSRFQQKKQEKRKEREAIARNKSNKIIEQPNGEFYNPLRNQYFYVSAQKTIQFSGNRGDADSDNYRTIKTVYCKTKDEADRLLEEDILEWIQYLEGSDVRDVQIISETRYRKIEDEKVPVYQEKSAVKRVLSEYKVKHKKKYRISSAARLRRNARNKKWKERYYTTRLGRIKRRIYRKKWKRKYYGTNKGREARKRYR